jgi:hypothetical protein
LSIVDFEERYTIRIKSVDLKFIKKICDKNQDIYFNESHFIRCAILRLSREYDLNGRRIKRH